jgi:hypothetical protein
VVSIGAFALREGDADAPAISTGVHRESLAYQRRFVRIGWRDGGGPSASEEPVTMTGVREDASRD